jgi:hypothetical protein
LILHCFDTTLVYPYHNMNVWKYLVTRVDTGFVVKQSNPVCNTRRKSFMTFSVFSFSFYVRRIGAGGGRYRGNAFRLQFMGRVIVPGKWPQERILSIKISLSIFLAISPLGAPPPPPFRSLSSSTLSFSLHLILSHPFLLSPIFIGLSSLKDKTQIRQCKMSSSKKFTCEGTLRLVFICLRRRTLHPLPPCTLYTCIQYWHREGGRVESWTRENVGEIHTVFPYIK